MTILGIIRMVADHHDITEGDICGDGRQRRIAWPRQEAMFVARQATGHSLPKIGWVFGDRDHTTVMHGIRAVEKRMKGDPDLVSRIASFTIEAMGVTVK